jgi:hypothetical protein
VPIGFCADGSPLVWSALHPAMQGGAHTGAGCPPQNKGTTDTVLSCSQLFTGPSLSGSSKAVHPLFRGNNNDSQVSPILDGSLDVQPDPMKCVIGSEHSPPATCEFQIPYNN